MRALSSEARSLSLNTSFQDHDTLNDSILTHPDSTQVNTEVDKIILKSLPLNLQIPSPSLIYALDDHLLLDKQNS